MFGVRILFTREGELAAIGSKEFSVTVFSALYGLENSDALFVLYALYAFVAGYGVLLRFTVESIVVACE
jgi:hypothetical protein